VQIIILCALAFLTLFATVAFAKTYSSIVLGQNNKDFDVKAIQDAVDKGGTILLKGQFDFGEEGRVTIRNDIKIFGEINSEGEPLTRINGGNWTFHSTLEKSLPDGPGPQIVIQGIHFDGAYYTPLCFGYTSGAEISGNRITNVIPYKVYLWAGKSIMWQAGAVFGTQFIRGMTTTIPEAVTGRIIFHNNRVDLKNTKPKETLGQGVYIQKTWGAMIEISENLFTNVSRNSIECFDNYRDKEGRGEIIIRKNRVITPVKGCPFPTATSYPNGIIVGWFFDNTGGVDRKRNSKILIAQNYVQTNGELSLGILSLANGTAIIGNWVDARGGPKSKPIRQRGSNGVIARNKIDGIGKWAIGVMPHSVFKASDNVIAWNDVKAFKSSGADIVCEGSQNTVFGKDCKFVDKGQDNNVFIEN
jgi:hypothetical protein